jgi:hypothetical protein
MNKRQRKKYRKKKIALFIKKATQFSKKYLRGILLGVLFISFKGDFEEFKKRIKKHSLNE